MLPELSARKALEIVRKGHSLWCDADANHVAEYARACAILAALVEESEACDMEPGTVASFNAWSDAKDKRRRLERGEES